MASSRAETPTTCANISTYKPPVSLDRSYFWPPIKSLDETRGFNSRITKTLSIAVALILLGVPVSSSSQLGAQDIPRSWISNRLGKIEFPFLASVQEKQEGGTLEHKCIGSIINNKHILTSAKCMEQTTNKVFVKLGCTHLDHCHQELEITRVLVHPKYHVGRSRRDELFDLALLITAKEIDLTDKTRIWPVAVGDEHKQSDCNKYFALAGVGRNTSSSSETLLKFRLTPVRLERSESGETLDRGAIRVRAETGLSLGQFAGSPLVERALGDSEHCRKQRTQLVGIASPRLGYDSTSVVTNLSAKLNYLTHLANEPSESRTGLSSDVVNWSGQAQGHEEVNAVEKFGPSRRASMKRRRGSELACGDKMMLVGMVKDFLESIEELAKGEMLEVPGVGDMADYIKLWRRVDWGRMFASWKWRGL